MEASETCSSLHRCLYTIGTSTVLYTVCIQRLSQSESVCDLFKKETEHLYLRQPIHGIGRDPFRPFMRDVSGGRFYFTASASS